MRNASKHTNHRGYVVSVHVENDTFSKEWTTSMLMTGTGDRGQLGCLSCQLWPLLPNVTSRCPQPSTWVLALRIIHANMCMFWVDNKCMV